MTQTAPFVRTFGPFCSAWVERWRARKQRICCAVASSHLRRQERLATLVLAVHAHSWLSSVQCTANTLPVHCNSLCVRAVVGIVYTLTWIPFSNHGRARWLAAAVVAAAGLQVSAAPCYGTIFQGKNFRVSGAVSYTRSISCRRGVCILWQNLNGSCCVTHDSVSAVACPPAGVMQVVLVGLGLLKDRNLIEGMSVSGRYTHCTGTGRCKPQPAPAGGYFDASAAA